MSKAPAANTTNCLLICWCKTIIVSNSTWPSVSTIVFGCLITVSVLNISTAILMTVSLLQVNI